jgi:hypothetical protein
MRPPAGGFQRPLIDFDRLDVAGGPSWGSWRQQRIRAFGPGGSADFERMREAALRRAGAANTNRGFMAPGVAVRDLEWVKGVTADGREVELPMPGSDAARRMRAQRWGQQQQPLQQGERPLQQTQQQPARPQQQITGYILGLKNGTTLRVARPDGARWRSGQRWAQRPASLALTPLGDQQQQQRVRPWQELQDPPRVDLMSTSDRLREIRERMDRMIAASGGQQMQQQQQQQQLQQQQGVAPTMPPSASPAPPSTPAPPATERQANELPQPELQQEEKRD